VPEMRAREHKGEGIMESKEMTPEEAIQGLIDALNNYQKEWEGAFKFTNKIYDRIMNCQCQTCLQENKEDSL
jgi:hypothetical protein